MPIIFLQSSPKKFHAGETPNRNSKLKFVLKMESLAKQWKHKGRPYIRTALKDRFRVAIFIGLRFRTLGKILFKKNTGDSRGKGNPLPGKRG